MWKSNRKGEIQPCSQCGETYEHYSTNKNKACKPCRMKIHSSRGRLKPEDKKKPYPLDNKERKKRYTRLRNAFIEFQTREERTIYYDNILKEMEETGIMLWCVDLRPGTKPRGVREGKGRMSNAQRNPLLKYPNTKQMPE